MRTAVITLFAGSRVCMDRLAVRTIVLFRKARLKRPLTEPSYRHHRDSGDALSGDVSPARDCCAWLPQRRGPLNTAVRGKDEIE